MDAAPVMMNLPLFLGALAITLIVELMASAAFLSMKRIRDKQILEYVVIVNLITMPVGIYLFPILFTGVALTILAEVFAIALEAVLLHLVSKELSMKNAFALSILMNLGSFFIGGAIFGYLDATVL